MRAVGSLVSSPGAKQVVELKATQIELVGECSADNYPLQKKRHTLEFLRGLAHLRPRTNTIGAVARVRSALAYATHEFFQGAGFQYVHTPIISASDCEGAGEMFQVTTLLNGVNSIHPSATGSNNSSAGEADTLRQRVSEQGLIVKQLKEQAKSNGGGQHKAQVDAAVKELLHLKEQLAVSHAALLCFIHCI